MLNLRPTRWFIIEWHCFADHPALPLSSREWIRQVKTKLANGTLLSTTWKIRHRNFQRGGGDGVGGGLAWLLGTKKYSFLMNSPKLYDILLIPSPHWTADLSIQIRLLDDGYSLLGSKKIASKAQDGTVFFYRSLFVFFKTTSSVSVVLQRVAVKFCNSWPWNED